MVGIDFRSTETKQRCTACKSYLEAMCGGKISGICESYEQVENPLWYATKNMVEHHA